MPRVEIPFVGPYAVNRERPLSSQISRNMWAEINPEARNPVAMHNMAGTRTFATLEGVDRGMHEFNNLMYAVNGDNLYSIDADGVALILGGIGGTDRCVMANDQLQLIITTGATPYRYTVADGVEAITDPDLVNPTCVAYLNSQFLFDQNDGVWGEFVTSSVEPGLAIDALDFANAESHPDDIVRIIAFRQFAWMFGSHSVEPWQNTGTGNPPWARVSSGVQPYGLAGLHAIVTTRQNIYFLDHKRIPRRSNGLNFDNIGTPPIGVEFAKYSKIDDCICYEFNQDNQQFVVFTFPTANRTWCFHEETGAWSQLSHGVDDDRHRASSMLHVYGLNYCADHTNGLIYEYSLDIFTDNGDPIINERSTATIHGGLYGAPGKRIWFDEVEFIIVGGETEVAGTGLGPQPVDPPVPLSNCNDIYQIGTLVPDLHVAGQDTVTGIWDGGVIYGTGILDDDRIDSIYLTNDTNDYDLWPGNAPGQVFYPDCQWYLYCGPLLQSWFAASTCEYTDSGWTLLESAVAVTDTVGIDSSQANWSSTLTDNSATKRGGIFKGTTSNSVISTETWVAVNVFYKDATATNYSQLIFRQRWSGAAVLNALFSQADGSISIMSTSDGLNMDAQVRDCGDWWEVYLQVNMGDANGDPGGLPGLDATAQLIHYPAHNTDGTETLDLTATGSLRMGESRAYRDVEIYEVWAGALDPQIGSEPSSVLDKVEAWIQLVNHDDTEGGYYIEWRPMFNNSVLTKNHEILSLNDAAGLLYYDYTNQEIRSTDGTNTASVPLVITEDTKYRLGVVFGDSKLRVGVDEVWGTSTAYDGSFPAVTRFDICRDTEAVVYVRELRGFQIPYLDAFNEIDILMAGGGTGSTLPPPPGPDPQDEIVAPFYQNTGNWIDLTNLTSTTFETVFGVPVEGLDFSRARFGDLNGKAILVNTSDSGNRMRLEVGLGGGGSGAVYITDASGNVVDSAFAFGDFGGPSVLIPTGANYYIIVSSIYDNPYISKWDQDTVDISGSVSWESYFGQPFELGKFYGNIGDFIPVEGLSIRFTIPETSSAYRVSFTMLEVPSNPGIRIGAVNQKVLNFTEGATYTWGLGGGIDGGVNLAGEDIDLIPGNTYFFNFKHTDPQVGNNYVIVQASTLAP